jgi:hypothetical protein
MESDRVTRKSLSKGKRLITFLAIFIKLYFLKVYLRDASKMFRRLLRFQRCPKISVLISIEKL